MTKWFLVKDDEEVGPITRTMLKALADQGKVTPDSLVRNDDMEELVPASRVAGLFDVLEEVPAESALAKEPEAELSVAKRGILPWSRRLPKRMARGAFGYALMLVFDAQAWARGRNWVFRLPLLIYGLFQLTRILSRDNHWVIYSFDYLNITIHEMGHLATRVLGVAISCPAGTVAQLIVPIGSIFMFLRQRDYFAMSFCFCWMAENLHYVSWYMKTAPYPNSMPMLKILGPGEYLHDFNYIFSKLGVLQWSAAISAFTYVLAVLSMLTFLVTGSWLVFRMIADQGK
jgi:hypothetical protein